MVDYIRCLACTETKKASGLVVVPIGGFRTAPFCAIREISVCLLYTRRRGQYSSIIASHGLVTLEIYMVVLVKNIAHSITFNLTCLLELFHCV